MSTARRVKRAVNVSISADLLAAAREHDVNLSAALEAAVEARLRELRRRDWLDENRMAIAAYNRDVEEHGVFGDGVRGF
jgi:antitoxin CcdA